MSTIQFYSKTKRGATANLCFQRQVKKSKPTEGNKCSTPKQNSGNSCCSSDNDPDTSTETRNNDSSTNNYNMVTPKLKKKCVGDSKKKNKVVLRAITNLSDDFQKYVDRQDRTILESKKEVASLKKKLDQQQERNSVEADDRPSRSDVSDRVRDAYKSLYSENGWCFENDERFDAPVNVLVTRKIVDSVVENLGDNCNQRAVKDACRTYFRHLKKTYKDKVTKSEDQLCARDKQKRVSARRTKLRMKRQKAAARLDLTPEQQELMMKLTSECMTDEECGEEKGLLVSRKLSWRNEEVSDLISFVEENMDFQGQTKKRIPGPLSDRQPSNKLSVEFINY